MSNATGGLFLASAVLLKIIEMIRSEPSSLEDLFPGYNGIMPPAEELRYKGQFRNFERFGDERMKYPSRSLVKRDHIIFGVPWEWDPLVQDPCVLFPYLRNECIVYDINQEKWMTLSSNLSRQLGTNRFFQHLVARDQVAATHVTTSKNPLYKEAHIRACKEANERADIVEREQVDLLDENDTTIENSIRIIKEEYSQAYNRAFMLHLLPHGEYNIHGYKERQP